MRRALSPKTGGCLVHYQIYKDLLEECTKTMVEDEHGNRMTVRILPHDYLQYFVKAVSKIEPPPDPKGHGDGSEDTNLNKTG